MNLKQFIKYTQPELKSCGIKLQILKHADFGGYFCDVEKELVVWDGGDLVFQTLIHEFCHFEQYRSNNLFWNLNSFSSDLFFKWLEGQETKKEDFEIDMKNEYRYSFIVLDRL